MSQTWEPAGDGVHEYQQANNPKPDGTYTIAVREIGQQNRYPHVNFDYNPATGDISYNHVSFSKNKKNKSGREEIVQIAIAYLKGEGAL